MEQKNVKKGILVFVRYALAITFFLVFGVRMEKEMLLGGVGVIF